MGQVVLVTGVASDLAGRLARQLIQHDHIDKVVGVDVTAPSTDLEGVKFVRVDIRTPAIAKVLAVEEVDVVVHMDVVPHRRGGPTKETNVIGTMQLLAACQQLPAVKKFIMRSSCSVYGASSRNPAVFSESHTARRGAALGFAKEVNEVESYLRGFARRRPEVVATTFRFAHTLTFESPTTLGAYLKAPVIPFVLGFDPRLQLVSADDVLSVLELAVIEDHRGTFNVAGDGAMLLSQMARRLRKPMVGFPQLGFSSVAKRVMAPFGVEVPPMLVGLLMYGNVLDTGALKTHIGFEPRFSTADVFSEYEMKAEPGLLSYVVGE